MNDLTTFLETSRLQINQKLAELIPDKQLPHRNLYLATRYATLSTGKRLRPILVLSTTQSLDGESTAAMEAACALEMVHTYSLIHDDLPAMDNDDFRRGRPTLHKVYPESHAILAGDFLLTYAFDVISHSEQLTCEQKISLIQTLSSSCGAEGLIGGQIMDLEATGKTVNLDHIYAIHSYKTAALIQAAFVFGGIVAKASQKVIKTLQQIGSEIGLAYQIIDDVLDVTTSYQKHGKPMGSDQANNKTTASTLLGLKEAKNYAQKLGNSAKQSLNHLPCDPTLLSTLLTHLIDRSL